VKRLLALFVVTLLVACATQYDLLRNYSGGDAGIVVASVGMTSANTMNFAIVEFKRKNTTDLGSFQFSPKAAASFGGTSIDFSGSAGAAALVQQRLPPGEYEIIRYSSGTNYGTSTVWYAAPENFSIAFTVRSGEVTYVGQYLVGLNVVNGKPSSSYLEITDESQRDLEKLSAGSASVKNEANAIVRAAATATRRLN
jgi:hypothetical protein